jgi:hypothetical protein
MKGLEAIGKYALPGKIDDFFILFQLAAETIHESVGVVAR